MILATGLELTVIGIAGVRREREHPLVRYLLAAARESNVTADSYVYKCREIRSDVSADGARTATNRVRVDNGGGKIKFSAGKKRKK